MAQWSSNLEMVKEESDSGDDQNGTGKDVLTSVYLSAANGLYHLYSQALHFHKVAFDAGQKHALRLKNHTVDDEMFAETLSTEAPKIVFNHPDSVLVIFRIITMSIVVFRGVYCLLFVSTCQKELGGPYRHFRILYQGKLNHWVQVKMQEGRLVTLADICTYLQEELNKSEPPTSQLWDIGSNWSGSLLQKRQETKPDASSSVDPVQAQCIDGNSYYGSQDLEMEITSEDASH